LIFIKNRTNFQLFGRSSLNGYAYSGSGVLRQRTGRGEHISNAVIRCWKVIVSVVLSKTTKVFLFFKRWRIIKNGKNDKKKKINDKKKKNRH